MLQTHLQGKFSDPISFGYYSDSGLYKIKVMRNERHFHTHFSYSFSPHRGHLTVNPLKYNIHGDRLISQSKFLPIKNYLYTSLLKNRFWRNCTLRTQPISINDTESYISLLFNLILFQVMLIFSTLKDNLIISTIYYRLYIIALLFLFKGT